jgi:hypothetical protein
MDGVNSMRRANAEPMVRDGRGRAAVGNRLRF